MSFGNIINGIQGIGNAIGGASDSIGQLSESVQGLGSSASGSVTQFLDSLSSKPIVKTENVVDVGWKSWVGIAAILAVVILVFKRKN